jgi:hypothetical protein
MQAYVTVHSQAYRLREQMAQAKVQRLMQFESFSFGSI